MRRALLLTLGLLIFGSPAPPALAQIEVTDFDVAFTDAEGETVNQAGAHPYEMHVFFEFASEETGEGGDRILEAPRDILQTTLEGFVGNPTAVPHCSTVDFLTPEGEGPACPDSSAVGINEVGVAEAVASGPFFAAIYNLAPPPGVAAKLGFWVKGVPVTVELGVEQTPPYRITGGSTDTSQLVEVLSAALTLWGVPADPAHDEVRGSCLDTNSGESKGICEAELSEVPFLTTPRACEGPVESRYKVDSWPDPGQYDEGGALTHNSLGEPEGFKGCEKLLFDPEVSVRPTTSAAESPSGLDLEIDVEDPAYRSPGPSAEADIEASVFRLPAGVTLNPSAAEGLGVCSEAEFDAASLSAQGCPDAAKLGGLEVTSPVLEGRTLTGAFYLAAPHANPFGSLFAAYLILSEPERGAFFKLPALIETDPASGQIVTTVEDMPPYPLEHVKVHLRAGPRAPLITPSACGTYTTEAELFPSNGEASLKQGSEFEITSGPGGAPCPPGGAPPFAPGFEAGSENGAAGAYSPFALRITRADGEADLTRLSALLPPGVSGRIAGLAECSDAQIAAAAARSGAAELAAPSCPAASLLGHSTVGAGVGTALTFVEGSLHLAGPYKGAPVSIVSIVPAVAGPFDVGTVVTRFGLDLDPDTARVEVDGAASDPIPHILEGIPLKVKDLRAHADRPEVTLNPTSCAPAVTAATLFGSGIDPFSGADDTAFAAESRYQASSCASLGFRPKLNLRLKGAVRRAGNPAFRAVLRPRGGDANLRGAVVVLPPSQFIDNAHISSPCTRTEFEADACPPRSRLGTARAFTPLLDQPLEGPVYFRSNGGERRLPDIVVALGGKFEFDLVIAILQARNARVRTKVLNAPDVPVSRFVLRMAGGKKGLLENSEHLCSRKQRANLVLTAQNGRRTKTRPAVGTSCKKKQKARAHKRRAAGR
jgi:hypothetical protein